MQFWFRLNKTFETMFGLANGVPKNIITDFEIDERAVANYACFDYQFCSASCFNAFGDLIYNSFPRDFPREQKRFYESIKYLAASTFGKFFQILFLNVLQNGKKICI